jgi:hypothetical protein
MMMIANGYPAGYRYTHRLRPGPRNGSVPEPPGPRGRSLTASPAPAPGHWQAGQSQQPVSSGWSSPAWQASAVMPVGLPADTSLSHGTEAERRLPHGTQARRGVQRANNDSDHFHRVAGCHRTGNPYIDRNVTVQVVAARSRRPQRIWKVGSCDLPTMTGIYQSWLVYHKWYIPILVI